MSFVCQLNDRLSSRNFVGLSSGDKVLDAKTIWLFNDRLSKAGAAQYLFDYFSMNLKEKGVYLNSGQVVGDLMEKDDEGQNFFADSAYVGDTVSNVLDDSMMTAQIMERAYLGFARY